MSMKIYDFYKLKEKTYCEINKKFQKLRKEIFKKAGELYQKEYALLLTNLEDGNITYNHKYWALKDSTKVNEIERGVEVLRINLKKEFNSEENFQKKYKTFVEKVLKGEYKEREEIKNIEIKIEELKQDIYKEELSKIKENEEKPTTKIVEEIVEEMYEQGKTMNVSYFDIFENSIVLCEHNGIFYAKLFLRPYAHKLFLEIFKEAEDKYFQNSTDRPSEIEKEDWEERERVVNEIFTNVGTFKEAGLVAEMSIELFLLKWDYNKKEEIKKYIPSIEERKKEKAKREIINDFFEKNKELKYHKRTNLFIEYKQTKEYEEELKKKMEKIELKEIIL